jgi:integrase
MAQDVDTITKSDMLKGEFSIADHRRKKKIVLDDVWSKYLPIIKNTNKSWRDDKYNYESHIQPAFGSIELSKISVFSVEKFKRSFKGKLNLRGKAFEPATIKHQMVLLRRLLNMAIKWNMLSTLNPVCQVSMPKINNEVVRFLEAEQLSELIRILDIWPVKQSANFIRFLMFTGCRRGEAFSLKWEHVDMERGLITLLNPKGGKTVKLPLNAMAIDVLKSVDRKGDFVFPGKTGERLTNITCWRRIKKLAKLPREFRLHDLRHHFASTLVSGGVDIFTVSRLLSHKDVGTTRRYAHLSDAAMKTATDRAEELFNPKVAEIIQLKRG